MFRLFMKASKDKYCKHLPSISRETLKKLTESEPSQHCSLHEHSIYYLCLHCSQACCLDYQQNLTCIQYHFKENPTHYFALQMQLGSIWCSACNDSIQNMIFGFGQQKDEQYLKMNRFSAFVGDIWKQISSKMNIRKKVVIHRGLKNLGNTCFLNSVLQCLYAADPLRQLYNQYGRSDNKLKYGKRLIPKQIEYFYDDMIEKKSAEQWNVVTSKKQKKQNQSHKFYKKTITNAQFSFMVQKFMKQMEKQGSECFSPADIIEYIGKINQKYQLTEQQDAEELLLLVIDLMSECERVSLLQDTERYKQIEKILGFQKLVPVQWIFGFYLYNEIQCSQCKQVTTCMNLTYNLGISLDSTSNEQYKIEHKDDKVEVDFWEELKYPSCEGSCQLLDGFFQMERLNLSNNYYSCGKCKSLVAYRKHYIISQPEILVVSVKRFNSKLQKNNKKVPIEANIDIGHLCMSGEEFKYQLFGVIVHEGRTLHTGHYICFIKVEGSWLLCSDHRVQLVNWSQVQSQQAYILLYQRIKEQ